MEYNKESILPNKEYLKLENQLCFAFYVCSKEIIKKYRPVLDPLGLTYTGYIVMLALWEKDNITMRTLGERLYLDSGTLTPLLKKLEKQGYLTRERGLQNERNVYIKLTETGYDLQKKASVIPLQLKNEMNYATKDIKRLLKEIHTIIELL